MMKKGETSKVQMPDTANKRKKEVVPRNDLFFALAEQTSDIIVLVNREGIITYVNPAVDILGISAEKRIGASVFERIHPDDLKTVKDAFYILFSDTKAPVQKAEIRVRCTDGSWRIFEIIGSNLVHDNVVESLVVNLRDITERKKAESQKEVALEALRKSEKYFKEITENSSDIFILTDKNGDIKYCSRSTERFTGYKPEELIGQSCFNYVHPDEVKRAVDDYGRAILAKDTTLIPNAFRVVHKDGSEIYLDGVGRNLLDNPDVAGFVMNIRDVTARKKAEENLFKSERKFSSIFHFNPDPMVISEIVTWKFIDVNQAFIRWAGFSREEIIGTSVQDLHLWVNPEDQEKITGALTVMEEVNGTEIMMRQKNGDIRNVLFSTRFIETEQERYLLTLIHDITERKNAENDLKRFAENLEDANIALRVLMNQRNEDQKAFEEKLQVNINDLVIPYLEKLKRANLDDRNKNYVSVLEFNLGEILSPFMRNVRSSHKNLTPKEIQIVDLIAKGKNTKEIADMLHTSISTITTHRNNIRKKLNLINSKINFRSYILSIK